jgi:HK97 family phage major capsid protein
VRWRDLERVQAAAAVAVPVTPRPPALPVISVKGANVPIGTSFVRLACAKVHCNGNLSEAAEYAKRWDDSTPEVSLALKAAIAAGSATDATWAGPLVQKNISTDFIELLRAATILGKIPNFRNVPFNTQVPTQTAGGTYNWVGEAKPKPLTKLAFATTALTWAKAAGIIAITDELARLSSPSAEALVRNDMIAGIARFLDSQFIDPAVAAVAGVNPASVTNGAPTAAATGAPLADIIGLINHFATNNIDVNGLTFIMNPSNLLALAFRNNSDGSPQFPGLTVQGGQWKGLNFIGSTAAGTNVIALQPQLVLYADDGGVSIDVSREASLQMDSAPMSPADATTVYVSLWQNNMIGIRAERYINYVKANANAVKYLTAAAWPAPSGDGGTVALENGTSTRRGKAAE